MPISPDIQRAIEIIDQRISSLVKIKEMLLKEFGIEPAELSPTEPIATSSLRRRRRKITRKETIIEFLRTNGPSFSRDIRSQTGIPRGTIATTLNDKATFVRGEDGKWDLYVTSD